MMASKAQTSVSMAMKPASAVLQVHFTTEVVYSVIRKMGLLVLDEKM
jgi:hypothetical protein